MTFHEYQKLAARTLTASDGRSPELHLAIMALGLAGEAGEVVEMVKKHVGHGHELDREKLAKELGDVLWYIAAVATITGLDGNDIAERNIAKLRARYPDGFSHEASKARAEGIRKQKPVLRVGATVVLEGRMAVRHAVLSSEPVDFTGRWQLDFGEYREWWHPDEFEVVT